MHHKRTWKILTMKSRHAFRALWNIYDGVCFVKVVNGVWCWLFSQESSTIDVWEDPKYVPEFFEIYFLSIYPVSSVDIYRDSSISEISQTARYSYFVF